MRRHERQECRKGEEKKIERWIGGERWWTEVEVRKGKGER